MSKKNKKKNRGFKNVYMVLEQDSHGNVDVVAWTLDEYMYDRYVRDRKEHMEIMGYRHCKSKLRDAPEGYFGVDDDGELTGECDTSIVNKEIFEYYGSVMTEEEMEMMEISFSEYEWELFHDLETFSNLVGNFRYNDEEFKKVYEMMLVILPKIHAYNNDTLFDNEEGLHDMDDVYNMNNVARIYIENVLNGKDILRDK